jgi:hypothetical protein
MRGRVIPLFMRAAAPFFRSRTLGARRFDFSFFFSFPFADRRALLSAPRHASRLRLAPPRLRRVAPLSRATPVASRRAFVSRHPRRVAPPLSRPPFATRRPRVTVLTQYSVPTSDACTFSSFFFLAPADRFSSLQVHGTPLSLASCEGGFPLLFSRRRALSAHKRVARHCRRLVRRFFFLFQVLTVPFSPIPRPFVLRRLRYASPLPHPVASAASPHLRPSLPLLPSPCRRVALTTSPLSRRPCRVALAVSHCPLFKCRLRPVASPRLRHASSLSRRVAPSSRVASPWCVALALSCLVVRRCSTLVRLFLFSFFFFIC